NILNEASKNWPSEYVNSWNETKVLLSQLRATETKILANTNATLTAQLINNELTPLLEKIMIKLNGEGQSAENNTGGLFGKQYGRVQAGATEIISNMNTIRIGA